MGTIQEAKLRPGDILLSLGNSSLSSVIRDIDGGQYSHAALWTGSGIIESTVPKVRKTSLQDFLGHSQYADVYRHRRCRDGAPVVSTASGYLTNAYGTRNLLTVTSVVVLSTLLKTDWSKLNFQYAGGNLARLAQVVHRAVARESTAPSVTCVELVALSYARADLPISVRLGEHGQRSLVDVFRAVRQLLEWQRAEQQRLQGAAGDAAVTGTIEADLQWLASLQPAAAADPPTVEEAAHTQALAELEGAQRLLSSRVTATLEDEDGPPVPYEVPVAELRAKRLTPGENWVPAMLTPSQLERSDDLELLGRL